jgi:hypothetical protein
MACTTSSSEVTGLRSMTRSPRPTYIH